MLDAEIFTEYNVNNDRVWRYYMDLKTNVVVNGSYAKKVYDALMNSSKSTTSNAEKRKVRLAEFSKNVKTSK